MAVDRFGKEIMSRANASDALADALLSVVSEHSSHLGKPMAQEHQRLMRIALRCLFAAVHDGSTSLPLAEVAREIWGNQEATRAQLDQAATQVRAALLATGAVATGSAAQPTLPLFLSADDSLSLWRHAASERRVASFFLAASKEAREPSATALAALRALAPKPGELDLQSAAVAAALLRRFSVVTGGPGTGKTTTILRMLRVLLAEDASLRIALAAPTGKAAARMDAARGKLHESAPDAQVARATTLHRLLGYRFSNDAFRHGKGSPLHFDVVVVDEASMVELEMFDALILALPPACRLVLLGDRDQLSSVGAGQTLFDLCVAARPEHGAGPTTAARCRDWLGMDVPSQTDGSPLAECVTLLTKTYRFQSDLGIGTFARAISQRDTDAARKALRGGHSDLSTKAPGPLRQLLDPHLDAFRAMSNCDSPSAALLAQQKFRVLCAARQGSLGVMECNRHLESRIHRHLATEPFYKGRPILVTANDYGTGLMNGDLGVIFPDAQGRLMAWFDQGEKEPRAFLPQRLPPHETAFAMTVHKSQGSEFDQVLLLMPDRVGPLANVQLLYTGVTRARHSATIVADERVLEHSLTTQVERQSGLLALLRIDS